MKRIILRMTAGILSIAVIFGTIYGLNWLFRLKSADSSYAAQMFYKQEKNSIDVLCLGSSHTYSNINPAILWDEYGMAAYDFAGSNQPLWNTYYYMKEALKYQHPELIVLDIYRATEYFDYQDEERVAMNTFGIRYSKDWEESLTVSLEDETVYGDYLLRYPVYHSRYQNMKEQDFKRYNGDANAENYKGFNLNCISTTVFESFPDVSGIRDTGNMTEKTRDYLERILKLAAEEEIPILLVSAPYMGITEEDKKIFNQVEMLAELYGVNFVDFNEHYEKIGFDPATDFAENSHLNYYGSEKYTSYLGKYISQLYAVTDRRGDARYASWEKNSRFYEKHAQNVDLMKSADIETYFAKMFANQDRYTICVALDGEYKGAGADVSALLKRYGLDDKEAALWVLKGGEFLYSLPKEVEDTFFYEDMGEKSLAVTTEKRYSKMMEEYYIARSISVEGVGADAADHGINVVVYDNELQKVVDIAGFDATNGYAVVRY